MKALKVFQKFLSSLPTEEENRSGSSIAARSWRSPSSRKKEKKKKKKKKKGFVLGRILAIGSGQLLSYAVVDSNNSVLIRIYAAAAAEENN